MVTVNGKKAERGMMIGEADVVSVKNTKTYQYLAYYKPRGLATQDIKGAPSVINDWKKKGIFPIGRLDKESEGLLILTNDGRLTAKVLGDKEQFSKEYIVTVKEPLRKGIPDIFKKGMDTTGLGKLLPAQARILKPRVIEVILREGKRHQIRVMLSELGYTISGLKRVRIGDIHIGNLKPGQTRVLLNKEITALQ
jgi:23S rRNA pseudouridine2604 synthase